MIVRAYYKLLRNNEELRKSDQYRIKDICSWSPIKKHKNLTVNGFKTLLHQESPIEPTVEVRRLLKTNNDGE